MGREALVACEHAASPDPRRTSCVKCGKPIPPDPEKFDLPDEFRLQILREAAQRTGLTDVADRLATLAAGRTHPGPWVRRDFEWEAIEETADGCGNYVCASLYLMLVDGDDNHDKRAWLWEALTYWLLVQNALEKARAS